MELALRWSAPFTAARVAPVTGNAELAVVDTGPRAAIGLVAALLVGDPDDATVAQPADAVHIAVADRDRILAAVQTATFGDEIEATLTCRECNSPYDLSFSLSSLVDHCEPVDPTPSWQIGDITFRPITGADELAALHDPDALLRRVSASARDVSADELPAGDVRASISDALQAAAPLLSIPLVGECPDCGVAQEARFDVQSFLLGRLVAQRDELFSAVHVLASHYHWTRSEIMALERSERSRYTNLIADSVRLRRSGAR